MAATDVWRRGGEFRDRAGVLAIVVAAAAIAAPHATAAAPSFGSGISYGVGPGPVEGVTLLDVTGDGRSDAVVASGAGLFVLPQADGAVFGAEMRFRVDGSGISMFSSIATADVDGDAVSDVAVATPAGVDVFYRRNGTLVGPTLVPGTAGALDVAAGDVNGDGLADLAVITHVTDGAPDAIVFERNLGGGAFAASTLWTAPSTLSQPYSIRIADLNGDGRGDIATAYWMGASADADSIQVFWQSADGTFARRAYGTTPATVPTPRALTVADVTGDGRPDVIVGGGGNDTTHDWVFPGTPAGLGDATVYDEPDMVYSIAVADVDGDRRDDVVSAFDGGFGFRARTDGGGLGAETRYASIPFASSSWSPGSLAVGDVTGDGKADAVIATFDYGLRVFPQLSANDTTPPTVTITSAPPERTTASTVTFTFSSDEPVTFQCALSSNYFKSCTSPWTVSTSLTGSYGFYVRGIDRAANVGGTAKASFVVDPMPANDNFADAMMWSGGQVGTSEDTYWATREPGEPTIVGNAGGHSLWFRWTPSTSGRATIDTRWSGFDTTLAVYTGSSLASLTKVAENNDDPTAGDGTSAITLNAVAGTTYSIQVDGYSGTTLAAWYGNLHVWLTQPPPNDAFANAQTLPGATGTTSGDTTPATREAGEPTIVGNAGGHSVWFAWTAPASGAASFDLAGSQFDTTLAVYAGSSLAALTKIVENDDTTTPQSAVTFTATAGVTYRIQVDGYYWSTHPPWYGPYTLNWSGAAPTTTAPASDAFANARTLTTASGSASGDTTNATRESGEPTIVGNPGGRSVWFAWTPTASGTAKIDLTGSAFDTTLAVYTGSSLGTLTKVVENDDANGVASAVSFAAIAGTTYRIQLDGYNGTSHPPWYGAYTLAWTGASGTPTAPPPANDAFANAQTLTGATGSATGDTTNATRETSEPTIVGNAGGHSVWFAWTAPASGSATVDAHGSAFDTTLAVYTGTSLGALTKVVENDDSTNLQSSVTFAATAGTTYRIQLDGYNGTSHPPWYGAYTLNWSGATPTSTTPANDAFANAQTLTGASGTATGDTTNATREAGEPTIVGNAGGHSVWFAWRPAASGTATFDLHGSAFDTTVAVYTGTTFGALTKVGENDDSTTDTTSLLSVAATAGTTYWIQLDGYNGTSHPPWYGAYTLRWSTA